jgi:hypothetical protein
MSNGMEPAAPASQPRPPFQFGLGMLFLLFVVLGSSLGLFGRGGLVVFALIGGLAIFVRAFRSPKAYVILFLAGLCLMCLLMWPAIDAATKISGRIALCRSHEHQIAYALQEYRKANGRFPPAHIADKTGKPMHSWRVLLLPYIDEQNLYKMYNFNEPWNGPNNSKSLAMRPRIYVCMSDPGASVPGSSQTNYLAVVGRRSYWTDQTSKKPADLSAEVGDSIVVVEELNSAIAWTEPTDLSLDALELCDSNSSALRPSSNHGTTVSVALADGSADCFSTSDVPPESVPKLLQIGGFKDKYDYTKRKPANEDQRPNWPYVASLAVWALSAMTLLIKAVRSRQQAAKARIT